MTGRHPDHHLPHRYSAIRFGNALAFSVPGGRTAPATARHELLDRLGPRLDPQTVELAQLLLSELICNCVQHGAARGPGISIDVTAALLPSKLRVEVCDGGGRFRHKPHLPDAEFETGRGLWLVAEMATRWGISSLGPARVWFELPRAE